MTQKRVLVIQDMSLMGKCSLTSAIPVIAAAGHMVVPLPTELLSTHTGGFGKPYICKLDDGIIPIAEHWKREGAYFDGIVTGYLSSADQINKVIQLIAMFSEKADSKPVILVDPAMGDNGKLYGGVSQDTVDAMLRLCSIADVILPNLTEAAFMSRSEYRENISASESREYLRLLRETFKNQTILLTGVNDSFGNIGAAYFTKDMRDGYVGAECVSGHFHGTGDLFTAAFTGGYFRGESLEKAISVACKLVSDSAKLSVEMKTESRYGLVFEPCLGEYIRMLRIL